MVDELFRARNLICFSGKKHWSETKTNIKNDVIKRVKLHQKPGLHPEVTGYEIKTPAQTALKNNRHFVTNTIIILRNKITYCLQKVKVRRLAGW